MFVVFAGVGANDMTLVCGCGDFDKGDYDSWYEPSRRRRPPPGEKCCECGAMLPQEEVATIELLEWFDPERPPNPDYEIECGLPERPTWEVLTSLAPTSPGCRAHQENFLVSTALWDEMYGPALDFYWQQWEDWVRENRYDSDYDRCERIVETYYRCDRCEGLAEAYEEHGYCMILPGFVIDANIEHAWEHSGAHIKWVPDKDGVLNPKKWSNMDYVKNYFSIQKQRIRVWIKWELPYKLRMIRGKTR